MTGVICGQTYTKECSCCLLAHASATILTPVTPHSLIKADQPVQFTFPPTTFGDWIDAQAATWQDKPVIIFDQPTQPLLTITYQEFATATKQVAHWLESLTASDPTQKQPTPLPPALAFAFENSPEVVLLNYAAWRAGWCSVPLDTTRDTPERKIYKLKQAECKLLITRSSLLDSQELSAIRRALPDLQIIEIDEYRSLLQLTQATGDDHNATQSQTTQPIPTSDTHPALILYTSGTTALPKGAVLTLNSLFANAASIAAWLDFTPDDRWLVVLPLHHINSTTFVNTTLLTGGTIVLVPHYSKSNFWQTLATHQVTGTSVVPTVAFDQLSEAAAFEQHSDKLQQVRRIQIGSAPVQPTTVKQFVDRYHIPLVQGYGQTETSLRSTGVPYPLPPDEYNWAVESNTLGTELTYTNVTVLAADGTELPEGEVGELCVRGPIIMQQYLDNPEETTKAFTHDWFHSGDTGYWQTHAGKRYFFLKGRSKEIIKKGGVLISPLAIENALLAAYPDLSQVYVIGFPDERLGEQIGLVIVDNEQRATQILSDAKLGQLTQLQAYEYPTAAVVIAADDLPKTSTGKVQRVELKARYAQELWKQARTIQTLQTNQTTRTFRLLGPDETELLHAAVAIDQQRWGQTLAGTLNQFESRARLGVLIGALEVDAVGQEKLLGTLSALRLNHSDLMAIGQPDHFANTWDGVTGSGTLSTHNHKGDALLLVAVASAASSVKADAKKQKATTTAPSSSLQSRLSDTEVLQYCQSDQDPVLKFHYTAKAGLKTGARFVKTIPKARPADTDALGYCVLVEYPQLDQLPTINPAASVGTQLVEAALLYAAQHKITQVFAYSRPVGLHQIAH